MTSSYEFDPPVVYNDWYVFPDSILSHLELNDCESSVDGVCHQTKNVQECIDLCKNGYPAFCDMGYFIQNKDQNICLPINRPTDILINEYYRLRNKNIYPELQDATTAVFFNKHIYPFPPDKPNVLFYTDHFVMKNISTDKTIPKTEANIQFLSAGIIRNKTENYIYVRNGDELVINIPLSALILRKKDNDSGVVWVQRISSSYDPVNTFQINTFPPKPIGSTLNYDDTFYFTYQGYPLAYDQYDKAVILPVSIDNALSEEETKNRVLFKLIPKIQVYYCDNGKCNSIPLEKTDRRDDSAKFNGNFVSRSPVCWGICENTTGIFLGITKKSRGWIIIGILLVILCFVIWRIIMDKK